MRLHICIAMLAAVLLTACQPKGKRLTMLQFNIWQAGTVVENGYEGIIDNIVSLDPDLITFSEVRNYNGVSLIPRLMKDLEARGVHYYGKESESTGILSKYEILSQEIVYPLKNDRGSVVKARVRMGDKEIALYSAHLDWLNCAYYLPRGYDGCTWKPLSGPVLRVDSVLADNRASFRDDEVRAIVNDAQKEREQGRIVLIGGDFNEPSHLDWQANTKDIRDHQGMVIEWDCSMILTENGYKDAFRELYPDPITHPGFTFPGNNTQVDLKKLVWSPTADERERIDFIYYYPDPSLSIDDMRIVGPEGDILRGERVEKEPGCEDLFIAPVGVWPTDHKALLATFEIK